MRRLLDPTVVTAGNTTPTPAPVTSSPTASPVISQTTVRPGTFAVIETDLGHVAVKIEDFLAATAPKVKAFVGETSQEFNTLKVDGKNLESKNPLVFGIVCGAGVMALIALVIHFL